MTLTSKVHKMRGLLSFGFAFVLTTTLTFCAVSSAAQAGELQMRCANTLITASPAKVKGGEVYLRNFKITLRKGSATKALEFSPENEFLDLSCFESATSRFLVINHYCGGSGCSESNYGLVELPSFRVLLMPTDRWKGNASTTSTLIGALPPKPDCAIKSPMHLCLHIEQE